MPTNAPRAVFVTRETDYEFLLARHSTREQARFFLETRGQRIEEVERRGEQFAATLHAARAAVPEAWRQAHVKRSDFDRFLFGPEDVIVAVGQDGLVANVAKYLNGQPVLGVNSAPDLYDGVLVSVPLERLGQALCATVAGEASVERRTMVQASLDNGERLLSLNEIFVGHKSHQSARYRLSVAEQAEDQSSSGLIVASGTGATGWARSIMQATGQKLAIRPDEAAVGFFVREPFPSISTGTSLRSGKLAGGTLAVTSRMNDGGVIFADGIEQDFIAFDWGRTVHLSVADRVLRLVTA
jgi:NAD kinase